MYLHSGKERTIIIVSVLKPLNYKNFPKVFSKCRSRDRSSEIRSALSLNIRVRNQ